MKNEHGVTKNQPAAFWRRLLQIAGAILAGAGWGLMLLFALLCGYATGWMLYAWIRTGSLQTEDILPIWILSGLIAAALAALLAWRAAPVRRVAAVVAAALGLLAVGGGIWAAVRPDDALFWARQLGWGDSTLVDHERFAQRAVMNAAPAFRYAEAPASIAPVEYSSDGEPRRADIGEFLDSTRTAALIVIQNDVIRYEGYANGFRRDSTVTAFSVSKSITSALIGIAVEEGYIRSVQDPIINYLPELEGRGLDGVTIRDLLMMSAGIRYVPDEEVSPLQEITQFTDCGLAYSHPDLRSLVLQVQPDGKAPGTEFNYNEYHPGLLGLVLERATGMPPAAYLQEKIWKPMGMEYPASWSLDSADHGFELMGSGVNGRAIDFAKFGSLFLHRGVWNGRRILSEGWVAESTEPPAQDDRVWHVYGEWKAAGGYYRYLWWGLRTPEGGYVYAAHGHLGQRVYVDPRAQTVIVRFGLDEGGVDSWEGVFRGIIERL